MDSGYHVVSTSVANESQAVELARRVVENIKLPDHNLEYLLRLLPEWHPYEVPEIVSVPVSVGHPPYLKWLDDWQYKGSP